MRTITILRHSKASKATNPGYKADLAERRLAAEGFNIAYGRRDALGDFKFDLVLASPAIRTVETARLIGGTNRSDRPHETVYSFPELCVADPESNDEARRLNELLDRLAYSPLTAYFEAEGGKELLLAWAKVAWELVYHEVFARGSDSVLVVGHAVLINALGYQSVAAHEDWKATLAEANFGECEGYILTLDDRTGEVTGLAILGSAPAREPIYP